MGPNSTTEAQTKTWVLAFQQLEKYTINVLPYVNDRIVTGAGGVYELSSGVNDSLADLVNHLNVSQISKEQATAVLRCIVVSISSIQRHLVTYGHKEKHFSEFFSFDIESLLIALGKKAGLPPRDSHYVTWEYNHNPTYVYDTNPGWLFFLDAVNTTDKNNNTAIEAISDIVLGNTYICSSRAIHEIEIATSAVNDTFRFFQQFVKGGMDTTYFAQVFRTYFLPYTVGGVLYTGSNATNTASVPILDFLVGIGNNQYKQVVKERFQYYTIEDQLRVSNAMKQPSLIQLLIEALGFDFHDFTYATLDQLQGELSTTAATPQFKLALTAVDKLVGSLASWSKQHFGHINTYLNKEAKRTAECAYSGKTMPAVGYDHGVGGATHEETKSIRDMRSNCELLKKLKALIY